DSEGRTVAAGSPQFFPLPRLRLWSHRRRCFLKGTGLGEHGGERLAVLLAVTSCSSVLCRTLDFTGRGFLVLRATCAPRQPEPRIPQRGRTGALLLGSGCRARPRRRGGRRPPRSSPAGHCCSCSYASWTGGCGKCSSGAFFHVGVRRARTKARESSADSVVAVMCCHKLSCCSKGCGCSRNSSSDQVDTYCVWAY